MEIGYGIPNGLHENIEDGKDIKMSEFEEGELVEMISKTELGENSAVVSKVESQETRVGTEDVFDKDNGSKNKNRRKNRKKKRKNKGNNGTQGPNITDINRFVTNVCKRLREKKSYLVWNAVACLGVSALSDLVKEVEAIQACGGQKTADGRRFRVGGGILWKVIKAREPNAYKDIMKRGKEFEQVPKTPLIKREAKDAASQNTLGTVTDKLLGNASDGSSLPSNMVCDSQEESTSGPQRHLIGLMEIGYGIPNGLHEDFEDGKDIKMSEFEEGELAKMISKTKLGENSVIVSKIESQDQTRSGTNGTEKLVNKECGRKKEKKKGNKGSPGPSIKDMSSFVTTMCKRLGERKAYLVWDAVVCLGVSGVRDLVKEKRVFWNIIKVRKPNAYKEITKRALEFEMDRYKEIRKRFQFKKVPKTAVMEHEGTVTNQPLPNASTNMMSANY
nr:phosphorylated adapter RNA export protein [Ipomoea batatas]